MKNILVLIISCVAFSAISANTIGDWNDIRFSGRRSNNTALLRYELSSQSLSLNQVLINSASGILYQNPVTIGSEGSSWQIDVPADEGISYYGLKRSRGTGGNEMIPVYYPGTALPAITQLSQLSIDPANDQNTNNLDIVADYVSFSNTKLYTGIQNRGGGFPTSGSFGTVYFSYMSIIADPNSDPGDPDTIVWALNYMNVPLGGISAGLYKITGTGTSDLIRIGNISTQIVTGSNLLVMTCDISALLADPDFAAWYDPINPVFGFQTLTSRTTIIPFATTQSDTSVGGIVYPQKLSLDSRINNQPYMSDLLFTVDSDEVYISGLYNDDEHNFPLVSRIEIRDQLSYDLNQSSNDFSSEQLFSTDNLLSTLMETPLTEFRPVLSDNAEDYWYGDWQSIEYILGITTPQDLSISLDEDGLCVSWQEVSTTLQGNSVTPSFYRLERSALSDFSSYELIGETSSLQITLPFTEIDEKSFYRVKAIKVQN